MPETVSLTFAELEYLLAERPGWPAVRERFGLGVPESLSDVRAAGLSSLLVRGMARIVDSEIEVTADLQTAVEALSVDRLWVDFAASSESSVTGGIVGVVSAQPGVLVTFLGPGGFEVALLTPREHSVDQLSHLTMAVLSEPGEVLLSGYSATGRSSLVVGRSPSDSWTIRQPSEEVGHPADNPAMVEGSVLRFAESLSVSS